MGDPSKILRNGRDITFDAQRSAADGPRCDGPRQRRVLRPVHVPRVHLSEPHLFPFFGGGGKVGLAKKEDFLKNFRSL